MSSVSTRPASCRLGRVERKWSPRGVALRVVEAELEARRYDSAVRERRREPDTLDRPIEIACGSNDSNRISDRG